jgi:hypothetical protein
VSSTDLPPTFDLAIDSQNRLYGAAGSFVYSISPDGMVVPVPETIGSIGPILAVDSLDGLYVATTTGSIIRKMGSNGVSETLSWPLVTLRGYATAAIGLDGRDNLYVIGWNTTGQNPIVRYDQNGRPTSLSMSFGASVLSRSQSQYLSIAGDSDGNAWFTDGLRINKYSSTTHEVLNQFQGFSGDGGPLSDAFFENPGRIARALNGNFYVLDRGNYRIRSITASPALSIP